MKNVFLFLTFVLLIACKKDELDINDSTIYKWKKTTTLNAIIRSQIESGIEFSNFKQGHSFFEYVFLTNKQVRDLENEERRRNRGALNVPMFITNYKRLEMK